MQPSNAKPSHISVFVLDNGLQSQPEKRSLLPSDGVNSIDCLARKKNTLLVIFYLTKLLATKTIQFVNCIFELHQPQFTVISAKLQPTEIESTVAELTNELISGLHNYKLFITLVTVIYNTRHLIF